MSERWRGVAAALLNPDLRAVLAEAMGGEHLRGDRRDRAVARLVELGLVREESGDLRLDEGFVRGLLAEQPRARPTGPGRFLDGRGRIDRYPVKAADRDELLRWVAGRAFEHGAVFTEREANDRLRRFTDDVAALRRHLVDAGLLERTASGSEYALASDDAGSGSER